MDRRASIVSLKVYKKLVIVFRIWRKWVWPFLFFFQWMPLKGYADWLLQTEIFYLSLDSDWQRLYELPWNGFLRCLRLWVTTHNRWFCHWIYVKISEYFTQNLCIQLMINKIEIGLGMLRDESETVIPVNPTLMKVLTICTFAVTDPLTWMFHLAQTIAPPHAFSPTQICS